MGTGWRRAFCTTVPRDRDSSATSDKQQQQQSSPRSTSPSPKSCSKLGFFSGGSNPNTPRLHSRQSASSPSLRCRTTVRPSVEQDSPSLHCKTTTPRTATTTPRTATTNTTKSPKPKLGPNPSSPRSPLKLSLFKNSFKFRVSSFPSRLEFFPF